MPDSTAAAPWAQSAAPVESVVPVEAATSAATEPNLSPEHIAERIAILGAVDELPLTAHVDLYQRLHAELQSALAAIDGP